MQSRAGGGQYARGQRVICRTGRGLEVGVVTQAVDASRTHSPPVDSPSLDSPPAEMSTSTIVRKTTAADELLLSRLERYRRAAVNDCRRELLAAGSAAVLLDVDQLFDCGTLVFYFLDELEPANESLVQQLAGRYESRVRSRHFAKLVTDGCGPGCGTGDAKSSGCSGTCAVCVVASKCQK